MGLGIRALSPCVQLLCWMCLEPNLLLYLKRAWVCAHLILANPDISVILQMEAINGRSWGIWVLALWHWAQKGFLPSYSEEFPHPAELWRDRCVRLFYRSAYRNLSSRFCCGFHSATWDSVLGAVHQRSMQPSGDCTFKIPDPACGRAKGDLMGWRFLGNGESCSAALALSNLQSKMRASWEWQRSPFMSPATWNTKLSSSRKMEQSEFEIGVFILSSVSH